MQERVGLLEIIMQEELVTQMAEPVEEAEQLVWEVMVAGGLEESEALNSRAIGDTLVGMNSLEEEVVAVTMWLVPGVQPSIPEARAMAK